MQQMEALELERLLSAEKGLWHSAAKFSLITSILLSVHLGFNSIMFVQLTCKNAYRKEHALQRGTVCTVLLGESNGTIEGFPCIFIGRLFFHESLCLVEWCHAVQGGRGSMTSPTCPILRYPRKIRLQQNKER